MYKYFLALLMLVLAIPALADNGLVMIKSANDVTTTSDKLVKALKGKGMPLMKCSRTAAIDLPQKMLIWTDDAGQTWLAYNDPAYMAQRHNVKGCDEAIKKVTGALGKFSGVATAP